MNGAFSGDNITENLCKEVKQMEKSNKKEFKLQECLVMWLKKSNMSGNYLSGKMGETGLIGFINGKKKNPKEPDIRIFKRDVEGNREKEEFLSLWVNVGKNDRKYVTGKLGEKRLVGWFNARATAGGKVPYLNVYFSDDQKPEQETEVVKQFEQAETLLNEELPF